MAQKRNLIDGDLGAFMKAIAPDHKLYPWQETIIRQIESMPPGTRFHFGLSLPRQSPILERRSRPELAGASAALIIVDDVEQS